MKLRDACHRWAKFEFEGEEVELQLAPLLASERMELMGLITHHHFEEVMLFLLSRGVHDWKGIVGADGQDVAYGVEVANKHFGADQRMCQNFSDWLLVEHGFSRNYEEEGSDPSKTSSGESAETPPSTASSAE